MECEKADIFIFMAEPVGEAPLLRDVVLLVGVRGLVAIFGGIWGGEGDGGWGVWWKGDGMVMLMLMIRGD